MTSFACNNNTCFPVQGGAFSTLAACRDACTPVQSYPVPAPPVEGPGARASRFRTVGTPTHALSPRGQENKIIGGILNDLVPGNLMHPLSRFDPNTLYTQNFWQPLPIHAPRIVDMSSLCPNTCPKNYLST
jgi:hypothetical protein